MAAMLEAEILAAEIEAAGSGEMMPAEALVVVETVYPRPYLGRASARDLWPQPGSSPGVRIEGRRAEYQYWRQVALAVGAWAAAGGS